MKLVDWDARARAVADAIGRAVDARGGFPVLSDSLTLPNADVRAQLVYPSPLDPCQVARQCIFRVNRYVHARGLHTYYQRGAFIVLRRVGARVGAP